MPPVARQLSARPPRMRTLPSLSDPVASSRSRLPQCVPLSYFGRQRGSTLYSWMADTYTVFAHKLIPGTQRDSLHVLDGLLAHPTINLDGRYRTTNRPPATGLRPLRIN